MKTELFIKLLRKVIREEVSKAVKEVLTEQTVDHDKVMNHGMNLAEMAQNPRPKKTRAKKEYSKNEMLNDILNETAATGNFASMNNGPMVSGGTFDSSMAQSFGASRRPQSLASTGINGEAVDMSNEGVATAVKAMTKDYSALMKAIDKKKGK